MEKLGLQKFNNYKLDNKQLDYIHAGEGDTGGGYNSESVGSGYTRLYSYSSDYVNSSGATFYNDYTHVMTTGWNRGGFYIIEG